MKKLFSGLMALIMLLTLCTACGGNKQDAGQSDQQTTQAPAAPSGLYYDLSGIDPDAILMTVGENEIDAELYLYWTCVTASNLEYRINMLSSYYGMGSEYLNEDGTLNWNASFTDTMTLSDYVAEQTKATVITYATLENLAAEQGVELTEDDLMAIAAERTATADELGGADAFAAYLEDLGISEDTFDRVCGYEYLIQHLTELMLVEGSDIYLKDTDCDAYATYADHILISTTDPVTRESLSEDQIAEKKALAEDILAQLQAVEGEEMLQLFEQLANAYSEDGGRAANPTGYIYTPGTMVTEFEDAASALNPGEISGLVESTYGYHIILRRDLAEGLAQNPGQKAAFVQTHLQSLIAELAREAAVTYSEELESLDHAAFYEGYLAATAEEVTEETAETDTSAESSGESK